MWRMLGRPKGAKGVGLRRDKRGKPQMARSGEAGLLGRYSNLAPKGSDHLGGNVGVDNARPLVKGDSVAVDQTNPAQCWMRETKHELGSGIEPE